MMIRRIVCAFTLLFLSLPIPASTLAASFSAKMVQTKHGRTQSVSFYFENGRYRFEAEDNGRQLIILVDRTTGKTCVLAPADRQYMEIDNNDVQSLMNNPFEAIRVMADTYEAQVSGAETVQGVACDKQVISAYGKPVMTAWIAKPYDFPIKLRNEHNGDLVELVEINPQKPDPSLLRVPEGYHRAEQKPVAQNGKKPAAPPTWAGDIGKAPLMTPPFEKYLSEGQIIRINPKAEFNVEVAGSNAGQEKSAFTSMPFKDGHPLRELSTGTFNLSQGETFTTHCKESPKETDVIVVRVNQGHVKIAAAYAPRGLAIKTFNLDANAGRTFEVDYHRASRLILKDEAGDGKPSRAAVQVFTTVEKPLAGGVTQYLKGRQLVNETISLSEGQSRFWHFDAGQKAGYMDVNVLEGGLQVRTEQPEKAGLVPPSWAKTPLETAAAERPGNARPAATASQSIGPDAKRMVLVLDASGSMWGQIQGKAKIEIAKDVLNKLIDGMPADLQVGLYAYGHRRKGDCADIEMLAPVAPLNKSALKKKIAAISPKGMTPLSEAVRQAARALRYTEERATVVLVSDGLETCDVDPCELAEELAMSGVDFTVHVIGFDISEAEQEQLRCLADKTGGLFLAAADAAALQKALTRTVAKVEEPPAPVKENPGTAQVSGPASVPAGSTFNADWQGPDSLNDYIAIARKRDEDRRYLDYRRTKTGNPVQFIAPAEPGDYELRYVHAHSRTVIGRADIKVTPVQASVQTQDSAAVATEFDVTWQGPSYKSDYIAIARSDQKPGQYINYTNTGKGSPLKVRAPSDPGTYEVRYILGRGHKLLAKTTIAIKAVGAAVQAQESADVATEFEVTWNGPDNKEDYITIARPDQMPGQYINYTNTGKGSPLKVRAPSEPGTYEVRYILGRGHKLLAKTTIAIKAVGAAVQAPQSAPMASQFEVTWQGPGNKEDYVSIARPDQKPGQYINYTQTRKGSPLEVRAPNEPGTYEVRYILGRGHKLLTKTDILITPVTAEVDPPASARANAYFEVTWKGPGYKQDFIAIAQPGQKPGKYKTYAQTDRGNPCKIKAPKEPGTYEVRYIMGYGYKLLAKKTIRIE